MSDEVVVKLCTEVLETGVHCSPDFPHCIDEERCKANDRCFWRGFHQLADHQYRKTPKEQKDLFQ